MKKILPLVATALIAGNAYAADAPSFPGGDEALQKYIQSSIVYPAAAQENGIEGVVPVAFTVNADGSIGAIKIVRMVDPDLEKEAIRIVKNMPAWIPADNGGTPVAAPARVDVRFILP